MQKTIVDYIKDSFEILRENKVLLFTGLIDAAFFMALIYASYRINQTTQQSSNLPFYVTGGPPPFVSGVAIAGFIGAFLLAGKLYMIRKVYQAHHQSGEEGKLSKTTMGDYSTGMGRFGLKILVGRVILFTVAFVMLLPLALELLNSSNQRLMEWAPAIIFLITLLFTLWDTIMVADDGNIKDSINLSISFVKKNYPVVLGLQIFAVLIAFQSVLSPNVPFRMAERLIAGPSSGIEKTLVELPGLYQGILSSFGTFSWGLVALLTVVFNVIAPMIFMDLYMDRRENNEQRS